MNSPTSETHQAASTSGTMAFVLIGPLVWAVHFTFVYGFQSVLCVVGERFSISQSIIVTGVVAATVIAAALLTIALMVPRRVEALVTATPSLPPQFVFQRRVMQGLVVLSLFAVLAEGAAAVVLPPCGA
ncbi:MAG: hypothetical protein R3D44_06025 [Hyphomicrobiaceae bacterium]